MSSIAISCIVIACIAVGILLGGLLRTTLAERQLCGETRKVVDLCAGVIATMTALVLGLMIASAKNSFDTQHDGLAKMSGNIIFLDRTLAHYGPEAAPAREALRDSVEDMLRQTWPGESADVAGVRRGVGPEGRYELIFDRIQALTPKTENQRAVHALAVKAAAELAQQRWVLFTEKDSSIPPAMLVLLTGWLALIFGSF